MRYEIYLITNTVTSKIYIGVTSKTAEERLDKHYSERSAGSCKYLYSSMRKHGRDAFTTQTLEALDNEADALAAEVEWIAFYNSTDPSIGYNLTNGGQGRLGFKHSEKTKEKMREIKLGDKNPMYGKLGDKNPMYGKEKSNETKRKISESKKGVPSKKKGTKQTPEQVEKNRLGHLGQIPWNKGKKASAETRQKQSEAKKGRKLTDEHKEKIRLAGLSRYAKARQLD